MARALPALLAASCLALAAGAAAEGEDGPATLAVLLVGKRARWEGSVEEEEDGTLFERTVAPALRERVLRVGAESGAFAAVDVVGHLWAGGERDSLGDQKGVEAALKMRDVLHTTVKGLPGVRVVAFHHEPVTTHPPEVCASPERRPTKGPDNCQRLGYFDSAESARSRCSGSTARPGGRSWSSCGGTWCSTAASRRTC